MQKQGRFSDKRVSFEFTICVLFNIRLRFTIGKRKRRGSNRSPHGKRAKLPCRFRGLAQQENITEGQEREKENSDVKVSLQIDTDYMIY